jgi:hypothetical protein
MNCHKTFLTGLATCAAIAGLSYAQDKKPAAPVTPATYADSKEWPTYGHDSGGMRYSPLMQITPANVSSLKVAWTFHLKPEGYVAPRVAAVAPAEDVVEEEEAVEQVVPVATPMLSPSALQVVAAVEVVAVAAAVLKAVPPQDVAADAAATLAFALLRSHPSS